MKALAFDPGPTYTAFAVLALERNHEIYVTHGTIASTAANAAHLINTTPTDVIAIEKPAPYTPKRRARDGNTQTINPIGIIQTSHVAGGLEWLATNLHGNVVTYTANGPGPGWRAPLTGIHRGHTDALIRQCVLARRIQNLPLGGLTEHHYDALGLCIVALANAHMQRAHLHPRHDKPKRYRELEETA